MKHAYHVETHYLGQWRKLFEGSKHYCQGWLDCAKDSAPRNAYRIVRSDGKIVEQVEANENVCIGMIANFPTAEQYESAAKRALEMAEAIRRKKGTCKESLKVENR